MGSGIGLALGAGYLTAGLAQAVSDHHRAVRIAQAADGGLSESMLQREIDRMAPGAARVARGHDLFAAEVQSGPAQAWPGRAGERPPLVGVSGRRGSALQGARDLDCLTEAVYFEARGETPRGQAAVAQVVMNRVANPNFPKTVCGVVFQGAATHGCQFSFACDGSMARALETDAWDRARRVAERALSGAVLGDIRGATHFHTLDVQPAWGPQMLRVAQVGLHVFYRFNPHAAAISPANPSMMANAPMLTSLPLNPAANLRLAGAVLEKASEVTASAAGGHAASAPAQEAKAAPDKASDAAAVVKASEPAESDS